MIQIKNALLNYAVRDFCKDIHRRYAYALETIPPCAGEHDGFNIVYLVGRDNMVVEVSYEVENDAWALTVVNTPFRHMIALGDGKTLDRVDLGETSAEQFLNEARQCRLWEDDPPADTWDSR